MVAALSLISDGRLSPSQKHRAHMFDLAGQRPFLLRGGYVAAAFYA